MLENISDNETLLLDGALGTEYLKRGLPPGKSTIAWNIENPSAVIEVHREYIAAKAGIITSNNFAGNIEALKRAGLADSEREINLAGIRLAQEAARGKRVIVAAGLGPTGEFWRDFPRETVEEIYSRQAEMIAEENPGLFLLETFFDLREALAALKGIRAAASRIPAAVTMTFRQTPRGFFTVMGDEATTSLNKLAEAGAWVVGANCTLVPHEMLKMLETVRKNVAAPLIMQPNAGQPELLSGEVVYRMSGEVFAEGLVKLAEAGADIVGGCCGSTPEMIALAGDRINTIQRYLKFAVNICHREHRDTQG